jgi:hypothetical protein
MKPWTTWLAPLGVAGSCLLWVGCGGSGVPDPESDANAASAPAGGGGGAAAPEQAAAAPDAAVAPVAANEPAAAAAAAAPAPAAAASAKTEVASTEEAAPADGKSEPTSATTEMLALASGGGDKSASASPEAASSSSAPGSSSISPTSMPGAPGAPGSTSALAQAGYPGAANTGGPGSGAMPLTPSSNLSGASNGNQPANMNSYAEQMRRNNPGGPGASAPGAPSSSGDLYGAGSSGPGGGNDAAPNFTTPIGAVTSFLNAATKKDPELLAEATALHAGQPTETSKNYQKVFAAVLERSLAPEDLDEIAKKFEGMKIMEMLPAKSTGRVGVVVGKTGKTQGEYFTRTITVRKEKQGWKVVDVSGQREFDAPIMIRGMPGVRGRPRR